MIRPGDLPPPSAAIDTRTPIITSLNGPFFRIYREMHKSPMFFGKTLDYRFDSASGDCGVLYASPELAGAFVETFMQELGRTSVSIKELRERPVALIYPQRPLRFIDLFAKGGQMRLGLDGRISTGSYAVAQVWSDALRRHPEKPDGILFPSRHELSLSPYLVCTVCQYSDIAVRSSSICRTTPSMPGLRTLTLVPTANCFGGL